MTRLREAASRISHSATTEIAGHIYDFPRYYDLVYGSDWRAEFDFLSACFSKHAARPVRRLFEPACGTGRLLVKFAEAGFDVGGIDLNPKAVAFCNARLARRGFAQTAVVGDMSDFRTRKFDAAINMINSFRHLLSERDAESHLRCVARGLNSGGLFVLCMHLTPTDGEAIEHEEWSARRGNLAVISKMWSKNVDLKKRKELLGMAFDVYTPTRQFRITDEMIYRTYTARQMRSLLSRVPALELVETYDFSYEIDEPITITPATEDVVFVFRKR